MIHAWAQPRVIFIHCIYLAKCNTEVRIGDMAQLEERLDDDLKVAGSAWCVSLFFFQQSRLVSIHVFTVGDPLSESLKRDKSNQVYSLETGILSLVYL